MPPGLDKEQKTRLNNFKAMCDRFIGLKAMLFAYRPALSELEVLLEKDNKCLILKFAHTIYIKTYREWIFTDIKVEVYFEKGIREYYPRYKFSDKIYFEVICPYFGISEIINCRDTLNSYQNSNRVIFFEFIMHQKKLTDEFPSISGLTFSLFRYHRWERALIFQLYINSQLYYLFCYNCRYFEVGCDDSVKTDEVKIIKTLKTLTLTERSHNFIVKCDFLELWNHQKFHAYDMELYEKLGNDKRYGVRKPINLLS